MGNKQPLLWPIPQEVKWRDDVLVLDKAAIIVPVGATPGEYTLLAGMYLPGGARLATSDGDTTIYLTTVSVQAP